MLQIDAQVALRLQQHTGVRLSTITSRLGMMHTNVNSIEFRAVYGEFGVQDTMNFLDTGFVEITASDSRLIRDQHCLHSAVIDLSDCRSRPGKQFIQAGMVHVANLFGHSSVTIHEYGSMHQLSTKSLAARQTSSTVTPFMQR